MKKTQWSLIVIPVTLLLILLQSCGNSVQPVEAKFAVVERADVHQVIPITGRIAYAEDQYIYAQASGIAARICVRDGERVGSNAALVRMEIPYVDEVLSAFAAGQDVVYRFTQHVPEAPNPQPVIRADKPCTVRQVLVEEGALVAAGTPLMRVSSHHQQIVCRAAPVDAARITPGMWAWIVTGRDTTCTATVKSVGELEADLLTGLTGHEVVLIPEREIEMPENASVDVDIFLAGSDDVLSIPIEAVTDRDTVWWVHDGRCTEISAQIVMSDEMRVWVHLPEGMTVAIGEFEEGQSVREVVE